MEGIVVIVKDGINYYNGYSIKCAANEEYII